MTLSKLTKHGHYNHLAIRNAAGSIEHWLLTDGEVERIRERSQKNPHLAIPVVVEEPKGFVARWKAWLLG
jgi:hypothetical protein